MPPRLSMAAMMDMPIDSSPLGISPTAALYRPTGRRKRPAQDMTQFAEDFGRAHKLVKSDHDELLVFVKADRSEQMITITGHLLILRQNLSALQPPDTVYTLPLCLKNKIDEKAFVLLMDWSLLAYCNERIGAPKLLMDLVEANPGWGFVGDVRTEKNKYDVVGTFASKCLTLRRNNIKSLVKNSCGSDPEDPNVTLRPDTLNIVELTNLLLKQYKKTGLVTIDAPLCGRVAILCQLISENDDSKYWQTVDSQLADLRAKYPDNKVLSKFIKRKILDADFALYGRVNLKQLTMSTPTVTVSPSSPATPPQSPIHPPTTPHGIPASSSD
ncbi:hypothetical protein B0H10DRAFT_1261808 [Mycena sp. CBHHK59/15]|nr:hypothetical protein B0H10DRAFT_1261808 [Mycena sp. CBHHK59/15]